MTRVLHYFEPATHGVPNFVAFLAEHQAKAGHHAAILGPNARLLPGVVWTPDTMRRSSPQTILASGRRAARHASRIGADVIHAHSFFAGLAIRLANPSQPVVYTPHAWAFAMSGAVRYGAIAAERALLSRTARVLCVSEGAAEAGRAELGEGTPIASTGSAIDLDRFSPKTTSGTAPKTFAPYAVCVGRISHQKGQLTLADQWASTMADHPLQLVFVGDGHPDIAPSEYPKSVGNVHFVGSSNDVPSWIRGAEFAIQPSRWEAMSLATAEALACGRAVVATDVAGMSEAIVEGTLAPAGVVVSSIDDIAQAARSLADQTARLAGFSAMARRRAEVLFGPERLVDVTNHQYNLALGKADDTVKPLSSNVIELRLDRDTGSAQTTTPSTESPEVAA